MVRQKCIFLLRRVHFGSCIATLVAMLALSGAVATQKAIAFQAGMPEGAAAARGEEQPSDLFSQSGMFATVTNVLLFVVGAISVIMIIIGGLRYILSGGDSSNVTAAKNTILYAVVGIIVALLAYAAVNFVIGSFSEGGTSTGSGGVSSRRGGSATNF